MAEETRDVFAKAGTEYRDASGQLIATLKRDVYRGEPIAIDQFEWPGKPPKPTDVMHPALAQALDRPS